MSFKTFLLGLFVLALGIFIYLKVQTAGDANTAWNQTTRYTLGKYPVMRSIFGLHNVGDARADYLSGKKGIIIEVVQPQGNPLEDAVIDQFAANVQKSTGKITKIYNVDTVDRKIESESDITDIVKGFHRHLDPGFVNLFIMYVDDFANSGNQVGKTYQEFGMILSDKNLQEITHDYPQSLREYQESTMLHEFGHQIGLDHNDQSGCIMNASVEQPSHSFSFGGIQSVTDFCPYELDQLKTLQSKY